MYISQNRIEELRKLESDKFDFSRLIQFCEEINVAYSNRLFFTIPILIRAILDHVPKIFGQLEFKNVVAKYQGGGTLKRHMEYLENTVRRVADGYLHTPIRRKEVLPADFDIKFQHQLAALLDEIINITPDIQTKSSSRN